MNESKTRRRFPPCPSYDIAGTERWLSEQAAQGWHLQQDGFLFGVASFEHGEPKQVRYRLDAAPRPIGLLDENGGRPEEEAADLHAALGWEYAASRGQFYIYRTDDPAVRELNTDPQVQALALKAVCSRARAAVIQQLLWLILFWGFPMYLPPVRLLFEVGTPYFCLSLVIFFWMFGRNVSELRMLSRQKKLLEQGLPLPVHTPGRRRYHLATALYATALIVWICLLPHFCFTSPEERNAVPLAENTRPLPFATIVDFVPGEVSTFRYQALYCTNTVSFRADPFAPSIIDLAESATATASDGTMLDASCYATYYDTAFPFLAEQLMREYKPVSFKLLNFGNTRLKDAEPLPLPDDLPVDEAYAYQSHYGFPTVLLRKDSRFLCIELVQLDWSGQPLPLDIWARIAAEHLS